MTKREVMKLMRDSGAVSVYTAKTTGECGIKDSPSLRQLIRKKIISDAGNGKYYLDESRLMEVKMTNVKSSLGIFFLLIVIIMIYLIRK